MPPSKQATDRIRDAGIVVSAAEVHAERLAEALSSRLAPLLAEGEAVPDLALLVRLTGRLLDRSTGALRSADEAHQAELADDRGARDRRDRAAKALSSELVRVREIATAAYGAGALGKLGIKGPTPQRDPLPIARFAESLAAALLSPELPRSRLRGYDLDRAGEASALLAAASDLEAQIQAVTSEVRQAEATLVDRRQATEAFDRDLSCTASLLSALLRLAGEDEHADRVRPSSRPGRSAAVDETPSSGEQS